MLSTPALAAVTGEVGSHDPSRMIESDGRVYIYSTGGGAKSSADGLAWKSEVTPTWNRSLANNQGIWAPDGIFVDGQYFLYGSMWNDSKASAIVLLTSPTLNPASAKYKWTDRGVVVPGPAGVTHSVIDPAPLLDQDGKLWVVWGGGYPFKDDADSIFLTPLDRSTGLALTSDPSYQPPNSPGYALKQGHKEGPYIHFHGGNYYLFYQTGGCCSGADSTYLMHVARSQKVTGPYTGDQNFYASKTGIHGPGHMGVYSACGFERFTYHYYPDTGNSVIGENELVWGADGWPTVGPASTTPLKLCGSAGGDGSAGAGGTSAAGGAGMSAGGRGGMDAGGAASSNGGTSGSAGRANDSRAGTGGSSDTGSAGMPGAGTSAAGSSGAAMAGSTSGGALNSGASGAPSDPASTDAGCTCRAGGGQSNGSAGLVFACAAFALSAWRRRETARPSSR